MLFFLRTPEQRAKFIEDAVKCLFGTLLFFIVLGFVIILEKLLGKQNLENITSLIFIIMGSIIAIIIIIKAGFMVIKSLFFMAAGMSLLFFLSQSYCVANSRTMASDNALKYILIIGFLYIIINFFHSLWKGLSEEYKSSKGDKSWENIAFIITFIVVIVFFIWQICLVVRPIIQNLCIYK